MKPCTSLLSTAAIDMSSVFICIFSTMDLQQCGGSRSALTGVPTVGQSRGEEAPVAYVATLTAVFTKGLRRKHSLAWPGPSALRCSRLGGFNFLKPTRVQRRALAGDRTVQLCSVSCFLVAFVAICGQGWHSFQPINDELWRS